MQHAHANCYELLGLTLDDRALGGTDMRLPWLREICKPLAMQLTTSCVSFYELIL